MARNCSTRKIDITTALKKLWTPVVVTRENYIFPGVCTEGREKPVPTILALICTELILHVDLFQLYWKNPLLYGSLTPLFFRLMCLIAMMACTHASRLKVSDVRPSMIVGVDFSSSLPPLCAAYNTPSQLPRVVRWLESNHEGTAFVCDRSGPGERDCFGGKRRVPSDRHGGGTGANAIGCLPRPAKYTTVPFPAA